MSRLSKIKIMGVKINFSRCRYDPMGQMFFVTCPKIGQLHILDMRGYGYFKDDKVQDAVAREIAKRIRQHDELDEKNDKYKTALLDIIEETKGINSLHARSCHAIAVNALED